MKVSRLLLFGPMQPESRMLGSTAPTPAAVRWTHGLLSGLRHHGLDVVRIGHEPARAWPYGPLVSHAIADATSGQSGETSARGALRETPISFINVPGVRWKSLARSYDRATAAVSRGFGPNALVTYNADRYYLPAVRRLLAMGVPWIPIVLDGDDSPAGWADLAERSAAAAGGVFLSYSACQSSPFPATFHLDGGIDIDPLPDGPETRPRKVVFYAGSRGPWAGVDLLLDAWRFVTCPDAVLLLCGQGESERLKHARSTDPRIVDEGMVPKSRLRDFMKAATVLVNPRPPGHEGNSLNFPSKILEYLGTGKPVVSTWTPGLAPGYRQALVVADPATPAGLAARIDEVLRWNEDQRSRHRAIAMEFCQRHGDWNSVADRFASWLEGIADSAAKQSARRSVS
jgi:glycosyltransferase involved in cell wall biosynthesis